VNQVSKAVIHQLTLSRIQHGQRNEEEGHENDAPEQKGDFKQRLNDEYQSIRAI
jgi:hypothetical protein